jgi:hypothetical protein
MPTKTEEYSLYSPGKLVKSRKSIYSAGGKPEEETRIGEGAVGIILSGPRPTEGFHNHCQVQFVGNIIWWVNFNEIEPFY